MVGNESGIREVSYDGSTVRTLSSTSAQRLRLAADGRDVVFYVRASGELRRLSTTTGVERTIAVLPRDFKTCGRLSDYPKRHRFAVADLAVQADEDFVLDESGNAVCMTLMDRNINMVNVAVNLHIDLATGVVRHRLMVGGDCAPRAATWKRCSTPGASDVTWAPFRDVDGVEEGLLAFSGRWSVLRILKESPGDYIHSALYLFDRRDNLVFPIIAGPFPAPIPLAALARHVDLPDTVDVVGESPIRWLTTDALLVDSLLVVPSRAGVDINGHVAR